jgi:hypothetical protein
MSNCSPTTFTIIKGYTAEFGFNLVDRKAINSTSCRPTSDGYDSKHPGHMKTIPTSSPFSSSMDDTSP